MSKKITILGKGTAGSLAYNHFRHFTDFEVECIFDSRIKEQSVGEGSTLGLPKLLDETLDISYNDLHLIDGHYKKGIEYINWGSSNYFHYFPIDRMSLHFNSVKLQNLIFEKNKDKVSFIDQNITSYDQVDSDFIIDCRGTPKDYSECYIADYIPVNSAYVVQCEWDKPIHDYTLCIARPYGWVFGIPLRNRISFGYLFNSKFNSFEEIEADLKEVLYQYEQVQTSPGVKLTFNNYFRKENYKENIFYNGNSSFFLEPMEATSIATIDNINRTVFDITHGNIKSDMANQVYLNWFKQVQEVITLHYFADSKYDTDFWINAKKLGTECMKQFSEIGNIIHDAYRGYDFGEYGTWWHKSFKQNIDGLGVKEKLISMRNL